MYRDADAETGTAPIPPPAVLFECLTRSLLAAVPQDDPMLVDAEENRRAHQHAQQALEQAAQRDGLPRFSLLDEKQ